MSEVLQSKCNDLQEKLWTEEGEKGREREGEGEREKEKVKLME